MFLPRHLFLCCSLLYLEFGEFMLDNVRQLYNDNKLCEYAVFSFLMCSSIFVITYAASTQIGVHVVYNYAMYFAAFITAFLVMTAALSLSGARIRLTSKQKTLLVAQIVFSIALLLVFL